MTYVKIQNGVVVQKQPYEEAGFIEAPDSVVPGFLYDGTTFTAPTPPQKTEAEILQEYRESLECTPLQMRKALRAQGKMIMVKSYMDNQATEEEQEAWEYATSYRRLDPVVEGMRQILSVSAEEVDQLFELALTFE